MFKFDNNPTRSSIFAFDALCNKVHNNSQQQEQQEADDRPSPQPFGHGLPAPLLRRMFQAIEFCHRCGEASGEVQLQPAGSWSEFPKMKLCLSCAMTSGGLRHGGGLARKGEALGRFMLEDARVNYKASSSSRNSGGDEEGNTPLDKDRSEIDDDDGARGATPTSSTSSDDDEDIITASSSKKTKKKTQDTIPAANDGTAAVPFISKRQLKKQRSRKPCLPPTSNQQRIFVHGLDCTHRVTTVFEGDFAPRFGDHPGGIHKEFLVFLHRTQHDDLCACGDRLREMIEKADCAAAKKKDSQQQQASPSSKGSLKAGCLHPEDVVKETHVVVFVETGDSLVGGGYADVIQNGDGHHHSSSNDNDRGMEGDDGVSSNDETDSLSPERRAYFAKLRRVVVKAFGPKAGRRVQAGALRESRLAAAAASTTNTVRHSGPSSSAASSTNSTPTTATTSSSSLTSTSFTHPNVIIHKGRRFVLLFNDELAKKVPVGSLTNTADAETEMDSVSLQTQHIQKHTKTPTSTPRIAAIKHACAIGVCTALRHVNQHGEAIYPDWFCYPLQEEQREYRRLREAERRRRDDAVGMYYAQLDAAKTRGKQKKEGSCVLS